MTDPPTTNSSTNGRTPRWPWICLALAAAWVVLIRIPLIVNSPSHLDSDLAVDGLTLLQATQGEFAWHYPGTPYMGSGTVALSFPQALIWGAKPWTLVSGGTVAYLGLVVSTFLLAWRTYGPVVAGLALVPLAFASNGAVWLSGRITGGHLTAAVFHAGLFFGFACLLMGERYSRTKALALGFWSGLGLWIDTMFALSLLGLVVAAVPAWWVSASKKGAAGLAFLFLCGLAIGVAPREIGARTDPYSAYPSQFELADNPELLIAHARLLGQECLPRLFAGHRLPGLETDPDPSVLGRAGGSRFRPRSRANVEPFGLAVAALSLTATIAGFSALFARFRGPEGLITFGLLVSTVATLAAFVTNRNIYNVDNYRYLVTLLVPAALGFGLFIERLWDGTATSKGGAVVITAALAVLMTADLARWYHQFGWINDQGVPKQAVLNDPTFTWLAEHPEIEWIEGGYWDVYRLIFLTGGHLKGKPYPIFPDRFPEWKRGPKDRAAMIARAAGESMTFSDRALIHGAKVVLRARGAMILTLP